MRKLTILRAAILALALATPGLSATAHAQISPIVESLAPSGVEAAAVADGSVPGWYRRVGEGPFSLRDPRSGLYLIIGGHAGFSETTRLEDEVRCGHPQAFFLGCDNTPPADSLGIGGGGSVGIGTRLTPALRVALIFTGETGYRFRNDRPWGVPGNNFIEEFSLHSYQGTANAYLDAAGLFSPGALRGWNPYLVAGAGLAVNVTGETRETETLGALRVINTYPGGSHDTFLWTAGAGVQYRFAPGVVADLSYQYVDAGHFRAATGRRQINGISGTPFNPPFRAFGGDLQTHRVGAAVNIEFEAIGRWFSRR